MRSEDEITPYQNLIGMLSWVCELGCINIGYETALRTQYLVLPRKGYLLQALNIFRYLKDAKENWLDLNMERFEIGWTPIEGEPHPKEKEKKEKRNWQGR